MVRCSHLVGSARYNYRYSVQHVLPNVIPVVLQLRLYALYCSSKKLLVFMLTLFATEIGVMLWRLIGASLLSNGSLPISVENFLVIL